MSDTEGTRGDIKRAVTAYGKKKYDEGFKAGLEEAAKDRRYKTITDAVAQAYQEGRDKAMVLYENIIEDQENERVRLCEEIRDLEGKIRTLQKQIDRAELPYDAMGDYSHNPMPNIYAGETNVSGFTGDDWYRENFKGE